MGWETQLKLWSWSSLWTLGGLNQPNLQVVETCQREKIATPCVTYHLTNTLSTYPRYLGTPCARGGFRHLCTGFEAVGLAANRIINVRAREGHSRQNETGKGEPVAAASKPAAAAASRRTAGGSKGADLDFVPSDEDTAKPKPLSPRITRVRAAANN